MSENGCLMSRATIFQLYVTAHGSAGGMKKMDLRSGSQRHSHFVGFFNVPIKSTDTGQIFLRLFRETAKFQSPFTTRMGIRRTYSRLKPQCPHGGGLKF